MHAIKGSIVAVKQLKSNQLSEDSLKAFEVNSFILGG